MLSSSCAGISAIRLGLFLEAFCWKSQQNVPIVKSFLLFQENAGLVVPWLIGILTFISFEALGLVYANVLKDQIFNVS